MRSSLRVMLSCLWLVLASAGVQAGDLAIVGARIYTAPDQKPIDRGTVIIRDGRITAVGPGGDVPRRMEVLDATGLTLIAGFWNSHVHFLPEGLVGAAHAPKEQLANTMREMFLRWGFTSVFDLASRLEDGLALRKRIQSGEVDGPRVLTCGNPFYPQDGTPIYVRETYRRHGWNDEVSTTDEARQRAASQVARGADGVKIFTGAIVGPPRGVLPMRADIAAAAVAPALAAGKPAFAHPTDPRGIRIAIDAGVNVLAHTTPTEGPWPDELVHEIASKRVALVPTLMLLDVALTADGVPTPVRDRFMADAQQQVRALAAAGGDILFGTDVGFIDDADPTREYRLMAAAGLDYKAILKSLTTAPAVRFGASMHNGRIEPGQAADLVVLGGDPAQSIDSLADVRYTIRGGEIVFRSPDDEGRRAVSAPVR